MEHDCGSVRVEPVKNVLPTRDRTPTPRVFAVIRTVLELQIEDFLYSKL